ncbi:unnamed protein product, partial [Ectocarpus fasciculatus]
CSILRGVGAFQRCGSTLIICPHKIRSQWEREIRARTKAGALKVAVYNGVREILSLGGKAKLASSKRRKNKRRRSSNGDSTTTGTDSRGNDGDATNTNSAVNGKRRDASTIPAAGAGQGSRTNRDQRQDALLRDALDQQPAPGDDRTPPAQEDGTPAETGTGRASPETTGSPAAEAATSGPVQEATTGSGATDGSSGGGGGDVNSGSDPFALLSPKNLASYDVVLTTFEVLRAEVHHAESRFAGVLGDGGSAVAAGRPSLRRKKRRYRVIPSPLPALKWWRVVVDEAHMVESTTQETAKMALKIPATHRWCVTGTPIGKGSIDDLYGLLVFLKASPLDDKAVWTKAIREPIDRRLPGAMERLVSALKPVMWRVTKASVAAQINIPPQTCIDRRLSFSSVEEHFYRKQHRAAAADAQKTAREGGSGTEEKMFNSLLALRQACCHPCIGSGGIETSGGGSRLGGGGAEGRWLSMDQILDRLIDAERLKAEEAQRKAILNLNASGAVARLILQAKERSRSDAVSTAGPAAREEEGGGETAETLLRDSVSSYQRALQMAEDNRTPGPVTGGAEVTGPRTMLPPSTKKPLKQQPAGAQPFSKPAADSAPTAAAATRYGTNATAAFVELRKPLALSWDVELAPIVGGASAEAGGGIAGAVAEREAAPATPQTVAAVGGEAVVEKKGKAEEDSEGGGGGGRKGVAEGKIAAEQDPKDVVTTAEGENGRLGDGEAGGTSWGARRGTMTAAAVGGGSFECRRVRDPAWVRLVFADRKR